MYKPPEVPLSIGGVLDDGFTLLKACFSRVFPLALVASLIGITPNILMPAVEPGTIPELSMGTALTMLVVTLLGIVFYGAIIAMIDSVAKNTELSFSEAVGVGMNRFLQLLVCMILLALAIGLGLFALVIPGIILSLSLAMSPYLVIADGMGPIAAIKRSHQLVWGNWWHTAAIFSVLIFIIVAAYLLVGMVAGVSVFVATGGGMLPNLVIVVLNALAIPVAYAFAMAVLRDLQLRKQGGDLDNRIDAITGE